MIQVQQSTFKIGEQTISNQLISELRSQMEAYFKLTSLLLNPEIVHLIQSKKDGWIHANILLSLKQIDHIFNMQSTIALTQQQKQKVLIRACKNSYLFRVKEHYVKRRKNINKEVNFQKILYFQGFQHEDQLIQYLSKFQVKRQQLDIQAQPYYYFVEFKQKCKQKVLSLLEIIRNYNNSPNFKAYSIPQFRAFQKRYQEIINFQQNSTLIISRSKIPRKRPFSLESLQFHQKTPPAIKPKPFKVPAYYFTKFNKYTKTKILQLRQQRASQWRSLKQKQAQSKMQIQS